MDCCACVADGPRPTQPGLHRHAGPSAAHRCRSLADGVGAGLCRHGDADSSHRERCDHVPPVLARGRLGTLPHLRGINESTSLPYDTATNLSLLGIMLTFRLWSKFKGIQFEIIEPTR